MSLTVQGAWGHGGLKQVPNSALGQPISLSLEASYEVVDVTDSQGLRDSEHQWSDHSSYCLSGSVGPTPCTCSLLSHLQTRKASHGELQEWPTCTAPQVAAPGLSAGTLAPSPSPPPRPPVPDRGQGHACIFESIQRYWCPTATWVHKYTEVHYQVFINHLLYTQHSPTC